LPELGGHVDFFQVGDFHDVLELTITDFYGKAKLRFSIADVTGRMFGNCHFYRHSGRCMAYLGEVTGEEGAFSPKLAGSCYISLDTRGVIELVLPTASPTSAPTPTIETNITTAALSVPRLHHPPRLLLPLPAPRLPLLREIRERLWQALFCQCRLHSSIKPLVLLGVARWQLGRVESWIALSREHRVPC
jgi:hypothetical protein